MWPILPKPVADFNPFAGVDLATLQGLLTEAQSAIGQLALGQRAAQIRDQNGDFVTFTQQTKGALTAYIATLQMAIYDLQNPNPRRTSGPLRFTF